jgi:putative ABC transport system permease protein
VGLYLILIVSWHDFRDEDPRSPRLYSFIRKEVRGKLLRTAASGGAIAILVGILLSTMLLTSGAAYSISSTKDKLGADLIVVPRQSSLSAQPFYTLVYTGISGGSSGATAFTIPPYLDGGVTQQISSVPGVKEATPQLLVTYFLPSGGCGGLDVVYVVGADTTNNFVLDSWLPNNVTQALGGNGAVAGAEVPDFSQLPAQGLFYGVQLERQAILPRTGTFIDHVIFVSMDTAKRMLQWQSAGNDPTKVGMQPLGFTQGEISAVFVKLNEGLNPTDESSAVTAGVSGVKAYALDSIAKAAGVQYSGLLSIFSFSGALVWVGSLALVATVAALATNERRGEIGVIRTLGGSRGFIRRMVATQSMLTTSVAGLIAILAVWIAFDSPVVYDSVILAFKMPYVPPSPSLTVLYVATGVLIVLVTAGVSALLSAGISARMDTYEAIRQGAR